MLALHRRRGLDQAGASPHEGERYSAAASWPGGCCLRLWLAIAHVSSLAQAEPKSEDDEGGGEAAAKGEEQPYEEYEVEILKPYGLKFSKGHDGGTYIEAILPGTSTNQTGKLSIDDKVLTTSDQERDSPIAIHGAIFGEEIWPVAGYSQTMYCIHQRVGPLYMKMAKKFGKWDGAAEFSEKEITRAERNSRQKMQREDDLRMGLRLYKSEALEKFESVLGSKPKFNESSIASYNVACCYSKLDQSCGCFFLRIQAGLSALEDAMKVGYGDFKGWGEVAQLRKRGQSCGGEAAHRWWVRAARAGAEPRRWCGVPAGGEGDWASVGQHKWAGVEPWRQGDRRGWSARVGWRELGQSRGGGAAGEGRTEHARAVDGSSATAGNPKHGLKVSVAGVLKSIDNDIAIIDKSFGFNMAVEEAQRDIDSAHVEACSAENGIGFDVLLIGADALVLQLKEGPPMTRIG
ncbi:hypothetical protein ABZP36_030782 [Zizania latifolia]